MNDTNYTFSKIGSGSKTVASAGTAAQLTATATAARLVKIKAFTANAGKVVVGDSTALASTGVGFELAPGESVDIRVDDVSKLYVDAANSNDGVGYVYFNN